MANDRSIPLDLAVVCFRCEGADAAAHEIGLNLLAKSLQGFANIVASRANAAATGTLAGPLDAPTIRTVSVSAAKHRCFDILSVVRDCTRPVPMKTMSAEFIAYVGVLSSFDMTTGACHVTLEGESTRIPGVVVDPVFKLPNNPYGEAMVAAYPLPFYARADVDADGKPVKLYIAGTSERGLDFVWK